MSSSLDRTKVTFAQAEGREELPSQLRLGEISNELAALLWNVLYRSWEDSSQYTKGYSPRRYYFVSPWSEIIESFWVDKLHFYIDEFDNGLKFWVDELKKIFEGRDYIQIFDILQFFVRHPNCPFGFDDEIATSLTKARAAYRLIGETIIPIASEQDAAAIEAAFDTVSEKGLVGSRAHLESAGEALGKGDWAGSVRESIHAVESALKAIEPKGSTLSAVLVLLEKNNKINTNLKRAMNALYDYTSDEKGIRHAKILDGTNVDEADAMYMFGASAAFITYVCLKFQ